MIRSVCVDVLTLYMATLAILCILALRFDGLNSATFQLFSAPVSPRQFHSSRGAVNNKILWLFNPAAWWRSNDQRGTNAVVKTEEPQDCGGVLSEIDVRKIMNDIDLVNAMSQLCIRHISARLASFLWLGWEAVLVYVPVGHFQRGVHWLIFHLLA